MTLRGQFSMARDIYRTAAAQQTTGRARVDDRRIINAIFYVLKTGSPWRDLPSRYRPYPHRWRA